MSTLDIPYGLEVATLRSEALWPKDNYLEYLEFTEHKINQICQEVLRNIVRGLGNGKKINLIVPLNGGLIFYRKLMMLFQENHFYANAVNVIFCDEDDSNQLQFSGQLQDVDNAYNLAIDDIWDKGGTGSNIITKMREYGRVDYLDYFAFCKKEDSPDENQGARIANQGFIAVFPEKWLHGWGGMNSNKFQGPGQAHITALERTSFLPLIPSREKPEFDTTNQEVVDAYIDLLAQTNLAVNNVIPIEVYYDVLFLEENPDLQIRFNYLIKLHNRFLRSDVQETIKVEG